MNFYHTRIDLLYILQPSSVTKPKCIDGLIGEACHFGLNDVVTVTIVTITASFRQDQFWVPKKVFRPRRPNNDCQHLLTPQ